MLSERGSVSDGFSAGAPVGGEAEARLDERLARPTPGVIDVLAGLEGDLLVLGAGGKMGPSLVRMATCALADLGVDRSVVAVSRFTESGLRERMEGWGTRTIAMDLLSSGALAALPDALNVIYMVGQKFGTSDVPSLTWTLNAVLPARVAERYADARIVVFSTGNVYPLTPVVRGGATESQPLTPLGEYANSCVGRERVFERASREHGTRCAILRLCYAIGVRYGVLTDVAQRVWAGQPVDLAMGMVNVVWQGDANAWALAALRHCHAPPLALNLSGPEMVSVRWLAEAFGERFGREVAFVGEEAETALVVNSARAHRLLGYPQVTLGEMVDWVADWIAAGGSLLGKPTHFDTRDGRY
jgi:nucleoside-diphosphate-sugar epimerase